jgi:catechol 2,3-dioxygenase-like lactoylglutathione lyase family enzyme
MISHVSIGVADIQRSRHFYDRAFAPLGYRRVFEGEGYMAYGPEAAVFWVAQTPDSPGEKPGPGMHICFDAPDRAAVDAFHAAALAAGGQDNGAPGLRPEYHPAYYAAFIVDPDGWRIEAYFGG